MSSSSQVVESWISSFCNLLGHEYFAEVSEDFIEDDFNLTGLSNQVPHYKEALEMILDVEPEDDDEDEDEEDEDDEDEEERAWKRERRANRTNADLNQIESSAEMLYGLIHQRYIVSRPGMSQMHEKYELGHFGSCPRVFCNSCKVLPVGCSDTPGQETVKLFCPSCLDVYTPPNSRFQTVDGAFFGTTFGSLFFMTYPEIQYNTRNSDALSSSSIGEDKTPNHQSGTASNSTQPTEINGVNTSSFALGLGNGNIYEPRIYGFRVSERAKSGPRMKWLRMKPEDLRDLDETAKFHAVEDMDEDYAADEEMEDATQTPQSTQAQVDRRKKAPIRRRRRLNSDDKTVSMDTNGVNGIG